MNNQFFLYIVLFAYEKCLLIMNIDCCDGEGPQDLQISQTTKVRMFPHVDGNYALHVYIPSKLIMMCKEHCLSFF
jgi:hypothetical protein